MGPLGPQPNAASIVDPQPAAGPLLGGNLQPFPSPDALHAIFADAPARLLEQRRDPPIPEAAILAGQSHDGLRQLIFVMALRRLIALRSSRLPHQPARSPFTQSFFPSVVNGDPAPLGT
jgi:hypothetical protein